MPTTEMIGKAHTELLAWLSDTWLQSGPPVCFLEGFPGTGKKTIARHLIDKVHKSGIPAILMPAPEVDGDPTDNLLLNLATELSDVGHKELADAIDNGRALTQVLNTIVEAPIVIIIDEFQRTMRGDSGKPAGGLAKVLSTISSRHSLKGRILLLTNRLVERASWSETYEICTVPGMELEDGVHLLNRLLEESNRQDEIPNERRQDVVKWLAGNPRAIKVLASSLAYDSLDDLIGLGPELWETKERFVSAELVGALERELLQRTLNQLSSAYSQWLNSLAVYRKPFKREATEALFANSSEASEFRRVLIDRFLMEHHLGWYNLHPIVREIGLQRLRQAPAELKRAHSVASRYYTRHFAAKQVVGWGQLGGHFVEARYHLVNAGNETELGVISAHFEEHIKATISLVSPVPNSSEELDERIAVLSALLETPGPKGLEYHLARLFQARGRRSDLDRAIVHAQRALGPAAPAPAWVLCADLLTQAGRIDEAIALLKDGIANVPPEKNLFSLYQSCGEMLAKAGCINEAIALLKDGIAKVPPDKSLFSLYQSLGAMLAQAGRIDEAIVLLKDGIAKVPPEKNLFSLYQSLGAMLTQAGRIDEAIALLKEGIAKVPPEKSLYSLYQSCGEMLAQAGRIDEAIALLKEGIAKVPPNQNQYKVVESFLRISQSQGNGELFATNLKFIDEWLSEPQVALAETIKLQLAGQWLDAAACASRGRKEAPTYIALVAEEAISWLGVGDAERALHAFDNVSRQISYEIYHPNCWLRALIECQLGNQDATRKYLAIYLGKNPETLPQDDLLYQTLLNLWDTPQAVGETALAYFFPILPPTVTGLSQTVSRMPHQPPILTSDSPASTPTRVDAAGLLAASTKGTMETDIKTTIRKKQASSEYDVFLCHNSSEKAPVKRIGQALLDAGLLPWLDEWDIRPGQRWQRVLQDQIGHIRSAAVFVGPDGIAPWQDMEVEALLTEFTKREIPIIPVILPECAATPTLPLFLGGFQWVDFRKVEPEPVAQLIWGITGEKPLQAAQPRSRDQASSPAEPGLVEQLRDIIRAENEAMRVALIKKLDQTSDTIINELSGSQIAILNSFYEVSQANQLQKSDFDELFAAMTALRRNLPTDQTLAQALQAVDPVVEDASANVHHRLKVTLPIVPLLLSYEAECEMSSGVNVVSILTNIIARLRRH